MDNDGKRIVWDVRDHSLSIIHIPGHQLEMPDSVNLLLKDASYLGFHTDCVLKSID